MRLTATLSLLAWALPAEAGGIAILIQESALAGSQFYEVEAVREELRVGDRLELRRDPANRHDPAAIRVLWRGRMLGHVPRRDNGPIAAALDRGDRLVGRVKRLSDSADPWQRLEFEVWATP